MTTQSLDASRYFHTPTPPSTTPTEQPGMISRLLGGAQRVTFSPMRGALEEGVQGAANRVSELFIAHQAEITRSISNVLTNALLRRTPEKYHQLLHHIQAFLGNPSTVDLDAMRELVSALNREEIQSLAPDINEEGMDELMTLFAILDRLKNDNPTNGSSPTITFNVSAEARNRLQTAEALFKELIKKNEGALLQTMHELTRSISAEDGPISALREQLNHPEHGVIAGTLRQLRTQLNSRADSQVREVKNAFDAYRSALVRNVDSTAVTLQLRTLQTQLALLLTQRELAPQLSTEGWVQIEQLDRQIQTYLASADPLPPLPQLLAESNTAYQSITTVFNSQRGMVEEVADLLVEGIARGVDQLVTLPGRMVQGILSPQGATPSQPPPTGAPQPAPPPTASPIPAILNIGNLASQGRGFLDSILASAGGALSQQAANSLATLVRFTFEKIRDHVQHNGAHRELLGRINPMIQRLTDAMAHSSWEELTGVLQEAIRFMQDQQVYLQGLRLPLNPVRTHVSAIPDFLNNINAHQNALQPPSHRIPQKVTDEMIDRQADLIEVRSASYGPARIIAEKICGLDGSSAFYADIYRPSLDPLDTDLRPVFRQRLFEKIDGSDRNFLAKWVAKRTYDLLHPFSTFYIHSMIGGIIEQTRSWIKTSSSLESKDEMFVNLLRNWMAVTSGAYNQVANTPASQCKDFGAMMEDALKIPERNGGLTQQQLYSAVGKTALDAFGPRIKWSETIDNYFSTEIPTHSPVYFLNPIAKVLNIACSFCLKAIVFVPQWLGNQVLQAGAKLALSYTPLLKDYSEHTIESLRRNTSSSYAMHRMLFRQQQKVLTLLQQNLNEEAVDGGGLAYRNIKKVELTGLVEYALEILNKSQYRTQDRLHNYLNNRASLRDRAGQELENTFLPELMETAIMTISVAMKTMTEEEEMQQMLYDGLQIANDAFDAKQPVSDEEFAALEKGIREQTDQILETALFHAIGEKFDFTNDKQKRGIAQFGSVLKRQTGDFALQLGASAREIARGTPIAAPALQSQISTLIETSAKYNKDRVDALALSDGNRSFHTETKYHFNEVSRHLLNHCSPLSSRLNQMKSQADEMLFFDKLLQPILLSVQIQRSIREKLQNPRLSSDDLAFCKLQLLLLREHLTTLRRNQCPTPLLDDIQRHCQEFSTAMDSIETLQKAEDILQKAQLLAIRLKQEKLAGIGAHPSAPLKALEKQLCNLLGTLPFPDQKQQLNELLLSLMLATSPEGVHSAAARFSSKHFEICVRNFAATNRQMECLKNTGASFQNILAQSTLEFTHNYALNQTSIQRHAEQAAIEVDRLNQWAQAQNDLPIWNLFIFDMEWVTETVKNLAFERANAKVTQLFDALYERHNYIGFVNQVALLPFLEKFGKHYLKKN